MTDYTLFEQVPIEKNLELNKELKDEPITDNVIFNSRQEMIDFFEAIHIDMINLEKDGCVLPADIFITNNIPILNMQITVKDCFPQDLKDQITRFYIFQDIADTLKKHSDNDVPALVGFVSLKIDFDDIWIVFPLVVSQQQNIFSIWWNYGLFSETKNIKNLHSLSSAQLKSYIDIVQGAVVLWYKIQISLLHPQIKEIFHVDGLEVKTNNITRHKKKSKRTPVKYIRKRVVNLKKMPLPNNKYQRKTFAWYVIGHYREYKNGKRIFIRPYWKGKLKEIKKYRMRDREMQVGEENGRQSETMDGQTA